MTLFFKIFPTQHWVSKSLRPYEMMNFPVVSAFYESEEDWPKVAQHLQKKKRLDNCDILESYDDLAKMYFYAMLQTLEIDLKGKASCYRERMTEFGIKE